MKVLVKTHNCALSETEQAELQRHIDQISPELVRFDPDLVPLEVVLERQPCWS